MRRATATGATRSASSARDRQEEQEQRIRALEAAFALEQQRRDELEKKYARLKRRYVRLEVAHTLLQGAHEAPRRERSDGTPESSPLSGRNSTPSPVVDTQSPGSDVIDLTSPVGSRRTSLASPRRSPRLAGATGMRNSRQSLSSDDFCAESPASPNDRAAVQPVRSASSSGRRSSRSSSPADLHAAPRASSSPRVSGTRRRQLEFFMPDPSSRPRPRPGSSASSPDEAAIRSSSRRRTRSPETSPTQAERIAAVVLPVDRTTTHAAAAASPGEDDAEDTSEAASIALAQYLQQQENMAAMREYEEHLRALEIQQELDRHRQAPVSPPRGGHMHHHHGGGVDPDNMTYEELLQLGEENGDVKKERWRQVAVQVLSSLPTHRWTTKSSDDISCIICQYGFSVGDVALTLPCAHVFHEECVTGWVRENNSCPLCKLEIADI